MEDLLFRLRIDGPLHATRCEAADEIERLRAALEPFARQDVSKMLSLEELDLDREDFERAKLVYEQKVSEG